MKALTFGSQINRFCYRDRVTLSERLEISDVVQRAIVDGAREGHEVALAHDSDPGANPYTFGNDRYHRSCELIKQRLESFGLTPRMEGAGHRARAENYELWFSTARSIDVTDRSSFDFTSETKIEAGTANMATYLPGMDHDSVPGREIVHVVLSGNNERGLTAVHLGRLISVGSRYVTWADDLQRIDNIITQDAVATTEVTTTATSYLDQPEPLIPLEAVPAADVASDAE